MDEQPHGNGNGAGPGSSEGRRKHKTPAEAVGCVAPQSVPCGACKFLRRKCMNGCIFAPYFGTDQGAAKFAAVHKVFGASNASKLLLHIPVTRRHDAVMTICYEAQARLADPVYGCVSAIVTLQQQVASVQAELALVQSQLMSNRYPANNRLPGSDHQHHLSSHRQPNILANLQPAYSNNSSGTSDIINIGSFTPGFDVAAAAASSHNLDSLRFFSRDEEEEEEESRIPASFASNFLRR